MAHDQRKMIDTRHIRHLIDIMYHMNAQEQPRIRSTSQARTALWERLFGMNTLPVLHAQPRLQQLPGVGGVLAYDLDLQALHISARRRLAAHVYRRVGRPYADVARDLETAVSWPIDARGCETAVEEKRPFFVGWWERLRPSSVFDYW